MKMDSSLEESNFARILKWRVMVGVFGVPLFLAILALLCAADSGQPWSSPTIFHPLGCDEFGRDVLSTAIVAAGLSLSKGLAMTSAILILGLLSAEFVTLVRSSALSEAIRLIARVIESIPVVLWVLIVVIILKEHRSIVAGVAFTLVVLPSAITIIAGELLRLRHTPFVEAAYLMGVPESRVLLRHILPNTGAVLLPFAVQILGGAVAVAGAIGVIGLGSRLDQDLGVFLIRGKENFLLHPQILLVAIAMYIAIYLYLLKLSQFWVRRDEGMGLQ